MSTSYYAERKGSKVRLVEREWDGIDRPQHFLLTEMTADCARYLAQQLFKAAEEIDGKTKKDRTQAKIEANTKKIAQEAKREAMS